ncbi:MAG: hypothetical protein L6420_02190, partial [Elusimicrobia bacterium]|nr:hypothetical protein [Elusimicrobiota bacterium]
DIPPHGGSIALKPYPTPRESFVEKQRSITAAHGVLATLQLQNNKLLHFEIPVPSFRQSKPLAVLMDIVRDIPPHGGSIALKPYPTPRESFVEKQRSITLPLTYGTVSAIMNTLRK